MTTMTQADFARRMNVAKSYVNKLKDAGRLVMTDDGKVDVEASELRIKQTADPNRDDTSKMGVSDKGKGSNEIGNNYQAARAVKERYAALQAKMEYERAIGKLVDKAEVQAVVEDVITQFRQGLENLPYRLAPELVGQDMDGIRSALKQEIFEALGKMQRGFVRQMEEIGKDQP